MIFWLILQSRTAAAIRRLRLLDVGGPEVHAPERSQGWWDLEMLTMFYRDHGTGMHYPMGRVPDPDVEDPSCWSEPGHPCVVIEIVERVENSTDTELCAPPVRETV